MYKYLVKRAENPHFDHEVIKVSDYVIITYYKL